MVSLTENGLRNQAYSAAGTSAQDAFLLRRLRVPEVRENKRSVRLQCALQTVYAANQTEVVLRDQEALDRCQSGQLTAHIQEDVRCTEIAEGLAGPALTLGTCVLLKVCSKGLVPALQVHERPGGFI